MNLLCLIGRHDRVAISIWWDGFDYRSECRRCGAALYKRGNVRWRRLSAQHQRRFLEYQARQIGYAPDTRRHSSRAPRRLHLPNAEEP